MRNLILSVFCSLVCLSTGIIFASDINEVYSAIERMSNRNTPKAYWVRVQNESFEEALSDLPQDIRTGTKKPFVAIYFKKGEGVRIVIENIKSEYASLFSMYEEYLKFSGISNIQNPSELKEIIDQDKVIVYEENKDKVVLKAWDPEEVEKNDNYALFTLDKHKWVIEEAVYFLDGNAYVRAENKYKSFGTYYLPYEIVLKNLSDESSEVFRFTDYHFE
jgi:hypothetical protein